MERIADNLELGEETTATCSMCGAEFPYRPVICKWILVPSVCNRCAEKYETGIKQEKAARKLKLLLRRLPYKFFDKSKGNGELLNSTGAAVFTNKRLAPKGVYLHGRSRTCKTRVACALGEVAIRRGYTVAFRSCPVMLKSYSKSMIEGNSDVLLNRLLRPDVLIIDEFGEGKLTERGVEMLYIVIDGRMVSHKPIWYTSNTILPETGTWMNRDFITRIQATRILARIEETTVDVKS